MSAAKGDEHESAAIPQSIVNEFASEDIVPLNISKHIQYLLNYARIVQENNVEIIFKNVPCPPKGELCDFYFEHSVRGAIEHWHFQKVPKKLEPAKKRMQDEEEGKLVSRLAENPHRSSAETPQITWRRYKTLADGGSELYFIQA